MWAWILPAHRLERGSSFPLLLSPSPRCVFGRKLTCLGTLSALCYVLRWREFLSFLPPLFSFLTLRFRLLFLAVKHLFFFSPGLFSVCRICWEVGFWRLQEKNFKGLAVSKLILWRSYMACGDFWVLPSPLLIWTLCSFNKILLK